MKKLILLTVSYCFTITSAFADNYFVGLNVEGVTCNSACTYTMPKAEKTELTQTPYGDYFTGRYTPIKNSDFNAAVEIIISAESTSGFMISLNIGITNKENTDAIAISDTQTTFFVNKLEQLNLMFFEAELNDKDGNKFVIYGSFDKAPDANLSSPKIPQKYSKRLLIKK